jgi:hypothetical protein
MMGKIGHAAARTLPLAAMLGALMASSAAAVWTALGWL